MTNTKKIVIARKIAIAKKMTNTKKIMTVIKTAEKIVNLIVNSVTNLVQKNEWGNHSFSTLF